MNSSEYFSKYEIKKGDNLYQIALRYNINPELLAIVNGIELEDYIYQDQLLLIPKSNYSFYITKDGDTLSGVSQVFNTNIESLISDNPNLFLMSGQLIVKGNNK